MSAVLDTHTVLWYLENSKELSRVALTTIEAAIRDSRHVRVSAISVIEAIYLVERKKIPVSALHRLRSALSDANLGCSFRPSMPRLRTILKRFPEILFPICPTVSSRQPPCISGFHSSRGIAAFKLPDLKPSGRRL